MTFRTRFAPSPSGPLHLGHAYSALVAFDLARAEGGEFLLRIEDIDQSRARAHWETQIYDDLTWLGLTWPVPVMRQSDRQPAYDAALRQLWARGLLYPCTCRRRDIEAAARAPQEGDAMPIGPDGRVYPGTCRRTMSGEIRQGEALRLNMEKSLALIATSGPLEFHETGTGPQGETGNIQLDRQMLLTQIGDVILARRDMGTSYHLSVVIDDAAQAVSHVVRGNDLFSATAIHVVLQRLLGLTSPTYHHHKLIRDRFGKRLAKRDDARAISKFRHDGASAADIRARVGLA